MFHIAELTDQVIDHLYADSESLRNCALVARSWVPAARYHIFFSVTIKHDSTCRRLCDLIARTPHIGGYIRIIYVYFEAHRPPFDSLRDLRVLAPRQLNIVNCPHTTELARISHLLAHPALIGIRFFSGAAVSRVQLAFLAQARAAPLRDLLLYSASDTPAAEDHALPAPVPRPLAISMLDIGGDATLVTSTLLDPHGPLNIRTLAALTFDSADIASLPRLLTLCGPSLLVLDILVSSPALAATLHIGRSTLPVLIDLRLFDIGADTLPAVPALLAQLAPAALLRNLRLAPRRDDGDPAASPFAPSPANHALWHAVDSALAALRELVSVTVEDLCALEPPAVLGFLGCFPTLVRKGILKMPSRVPGRS
ncbi:hypothetical protein B0H17DRAFT_1131974 [Mycena rosella]|uniref:Uncharacterized protein n=1 Tax=Mycena rosella TaxID=1033263 RepID=A0AAD7GL80_MYCRO|nr:hypothetical protein B0H17DRAFT_1131974 [Mycena rosella]